MDKVVYKDTPGYYLENKHSKNGIVLIQEWWGVDDNLKDYAKAYSDQFKVIVPDLYRNRVTQDKDEAKHLMDGMDFNNATMDILNLAHYLRQQGCEKVAVVGYCMGGALSICSAVKNDGSIDAGVCYYGIPPKQYFDYTTIKIPMQFHFGKHDTQKGFSDKDSYLKLKSDLQQANIDTNDFYEYDANHAFMNKHEPAFPYNKEAATLATQRTLAFLGKLF